MLDATLVGAALVGAALVGAALVGAALVGAALAGAALVGAVGVTDVVESSVLPGARNTSSTPDTTIATIAAAAAISAVMACLVRYQGVGAGVKYQVFVSNASKWSPLADSASRSQKLSSGSSHRSSSGLV